MYLCFCCCHLNFSESSQRKHNRKTREQQKTHTMSGKEDDSVSKTSENEGSESGSESTSSVGSDCSVHNNIVKRVPGARAAHFDIDTRTSPSFSEPELDEDDSGLLLFYFSFSLISMVC